MLMYLLLQLQVRSGGDVMFVGVDISHCSKSDQVVMLCLWEWTFLTAPGEICS